MLMMLVVSLRGVNHRFWSLLGCSGRNINIFLANKVSFRVYPEEIIKNTVMFILKQYLWYLRFKCSLCHALIELLWVYSNFLLSIPDFFRCSSFHLHSPLPPSPNRVSAASNVGIEEIWCNPSFCYIRQLLLEEKEALLGDIGFLQVQLVIIKWCTLVYSGSIQVDTS